MNIEDLLRETLSDMAVEEQPPPPGRFLQARGRRPRRGLVLATAAAAAVAVLAAGSALAVQGLSSRGPGNPTGQSSRPSPDRLRPPTLTVKQGLRLSQIFEQLSAVTGKPVREFRRAAEDGEALGLPTYAKGRLEGFAFPGTYEVPPSSSPSGILASMVTRFERAAEDSGLVEGARRLHRTPLEVVTVASIIEAETYDKRDMPKVARVIYNRLNRTPRMKLQLDGTVLYGAGKFGRAASNEDLRTSSPYNTYTHAGLPPGPIGNPGADAIEAALRPATGSWLYFVATDPRKGTVKFASSGAEFLELVAERAKNLRKG
ncbi:endolytic transglycosylase MltG [Nonomuraea sp. NPDC049152]|uniref:endolytic transglycosylase MltG n=1 Tax=Nonomuraea sp. NPDC049152 TaxID=3154350 RepID=UPI0033E328FF